ncbi:MAG: (2Fe-2S) ferredoxin domain-containing protein [Defluviitaleaceae bacterium]|nr:(2Fe-2S) ferredoxin domain-containing protein [Defluviitaleaceae bacterium]
MADKIKSWDELKVLRQKALSDIVGKSDEWVVLIGRATCGTAAGADQVMSVINDSIEEQGLDNVKVLSTGCFGNCYAEPVVEVRRGDMPLGSGTRYGYVDAARAQEIVIKHLKKGEIIEDAIIGQDREVYIP